MATFHLCIKSGGRGQAAQHAAYITRDGKFNKSPEENDLVTHGAGNLPHWCHDDPKLFWRTADKHERINGATYREFEIALPNELNAHQQLELVHDFISQRIGSKPYQYAIHTPQASLAGGPQPHAHIMYSDRVQDEVERDREQHFKRFNSKNPALGGCRKDSGGKERMVIRAEVTNTRKLLADLTNHHLENSGHSARVDHRSNAERGIDKEPERHLGPARTRRMMKQKESMDASMDEVAPNRSSLANSAVAPRE